MESQVRLEASNLRITIGAPGSLRHTQGGASSSGSLLGQATDERGRRPNRHGRHLFSKTSLDPLSVIVAPPLCFRSAPTTRIFDSLLEEVRGVVSTVESWLSIVDGSADHIPITNLEHLADAPVV